jgi:hypothetical protein
MGVGMVGQALETPQVVFIKSAGPGVVALPSIAAQRFSSLRVAVGVAVPRRIKTLALVAVKKATETPGFTGLAALNPQKVRAVLARLTAATAWAVSVVAGQGTQTPALTIRALWVALAAVAT